MIEFPKKYNFKEIEAKWQKYWQDKKIYKWQQAPERSANFVIDTPPPTVSGMLHMGHVFSYTQADFVARFKRMQGKQVFYPMGFDDNGLPTERLVEKIKKVKGSKLPREEFIALCSEISADARKEFRALFNSIALSVDWEQEYHTISPETRKISQLSFLDLYHKNLLEHKLEPSYWCPVDQTALAQADLEDKELAGQMHEINFALADSSEQITIATTRPELIPACVAIFVHPEDERYKKLIGKNALTALFQVKVPILADHNVAMDKGTGIVMCCTFGDMTDVMWWKNHKLASRLILNKYGKIKDFFNAESPEYAAELIDNLSANCDLENYQTHYQNIIGKKAKDAAPIIIAACQQANLLVSSTDISHPVKCAERSGAPIEILLTKQWFVKILESKTQLLEKAEQVNWYPKHMQNRIEQWINGLSYEWCISRQRYFGVPFPIWYATPKAGGDTKVIIADEAELPLDPLFTLPQGYELIEQVKEGEFIASKAGIEYHIIAEKDVMDTWATSSVTPQISARGISSNYILDQEKYATLFPADLRPQAHEIIRSWAFYSLVKAHHHENKVPWQNIMISGWCLASDKTKMSKSKGNVVTPVNLIEEKGSDIVRYWAATSHLGTDTAYSEDVLAIGKKLVNKLWNAAKFASIHLQHVTETNLEKALSEKIIFCQSDLWILARLQETIQIATQEFERYEYAKALNAIDDLFWKDFCDNYLEISKMRAYGNPENIAELSSELDATAIKQGQLSAAHTIYQILEHILKLYAPFIPHITEELYQIIFPEKHQKLVSLQAQNNWPTIKHAFSADNLGNFSKILEIIEFIRKYKSDNNLSLKTIINTLEISEPDQSISALEPDLLHDLKFVGNIKNLEFISTKSLKYKII